MKWVSLQGAPEVPSKQGALFMTLGLYPVLRGPSTSWPVPMLGHRHLSGSSLTLRVSFRPLGLNHPRSAVAPGLAIQLWERTQGPVPSSVVCPHL